MNPFWRWTHKVGLFQGDQVAWERHFAPCRPRPTKMGKEKNSLKSFADHFVCSKG